MKEFSLLAAIAFTVVSACETTSVSSAQTGLSTEAEFLEAGWTKLDGNALSSMITDHTRTFSGTHKRNGSSAESQVYYAGDGTIAGTFVNGSSTDTDIGKYTIADDGTYCATWSTWSDGAKRCFTHFEKDGVIDGALVSGSNGGSFDWTETNRTAGNAISG